MTKKIASLEQRQSGEEPSPEDELSTLKTKYATELAEKDRLIKERSILQRKKKVLLALISKRHDQITKTHDQITQCHDQITKCHDQIAKVNAERACSEAELAAAKEKLKELENKQAASKPNYQKSGIAPSDGVGQGKKPKNFFKNRKKRGRG
ncbi:MAG: hypothetical protein LBT86_08715 [Deltaproteobacteria bacterium]|nr:hypothetical protein [Deltaproteobacteria bacterium]